MIGWLAKKDFDPEVKVKSITEIFSALKIDRISSGLAATHYDKAIQYLERIHAPAERKVPMANFARELMMREK